MNAGDVTFFKTPAEFRTWLAKNHGIAEVLWLGLYKRDSGKPTITWPESVDEALCFGWIDGVRKKVDETSYTIRFSRRKPRSIWSAININRAQELIELGRMKPAGLVAFENRKEDRTLRDSYEQQGSKLAGEFEGKLRANSRAWEFFKAQPEGYQRIAGWYVMSAKKEQTRLKRLDHVIALSADGRRLEPMKPTKR